MLSNSAVATRVREIRKDLDGVIQIKKFFEKITDEMGIKITELNEEIDCALATSENENQLDILEKKISKNFFLEDHLVKIEEFCRNTRHSIKNSKEMNKLDVHHVIYDASIVIDQAMHEDSKNNSASALELYKQGIEMIFNILKRKCKKFLSSFYKLKQRFVKT